MAYILPYLDTTVLCLAVTFLISFYILIKSKSAKKRLPPKAAGAWPVIGHLPLLAGSELPHIALGALADKYGPIFSIKIGLHPCVVVSNVEIAREIYTKHDVATSCRPRTTFGRIMGYNYANFGFSPYGEYWREMRKITASELLSNRRMELLRHVRASEVEDSIKALYKLWVNGKNEVGHIKVEMKQWFGNINMNVILRMIAGKRFFGELTGADEEEVQRFKMTAREFFRLAGTFVVRDAIPFLGWLDLGGHEKAMEINIKEFDSIISKWLEEHRLKRESGEVDGKDQDFMDVMLSVLQDIDLAGFDVDTVCKATAMTLLVGGTDTTTVTVTWALALLLNNPNVLKKVQEELDNEVGRGRLVNESDIEKLIYFQAVVKETLRLYPAGPTSGQRRFTEDCNVGGYHVPAGTRLIVNIQKIQTDPSVWSNPLEFDPERFLTSHKHVDVKGQHFELIPFSAGRRACPGISFGVQMTHLLVASLLQAFEISTPSNEPVDMTGSPGLTNNKATPLEVLIKPRLPMDIISKFSEWLN